MPSSAEKVAYYRMLLESNMSDTFKGDAAAASDMRDALQTTQERLKGYQASLRSLRGTSEESGAAAEGLRAKIDLAKNSFAQGNLELLKQGTSYESLTQKMKAAAAEEEKASKASAKKALEENTKAISAQGKALSAVGGPLADAAHRFGTLKQVVVESGGPLGLLKVGTVAVAAAIIAMGAAAAAAAVQMGRWILQSSSAERSLQLLRKAMAGSEENASNLGSQVDELAGKLDLPKDRINALGVELMRTRLSGAAIVDTMNAVGQVTGALGETTGKTIQEMITRGQRWNNFQLNPLELQGTGIQFTDIAATLAKQMNTTTGAASMALYQGRVRIEDGAKAIRSVVEKQFGEINAEKLTTLDGVTQTWHKHLASLTKDVDWRPFGKGIGEIMRQFDASTVTGRALKTVIDDMGHAMTKTFVDGVPTIKLWVTQFATALLRADTYWLQLKTGIAGGMVPKSVRDDVDLLRGSLELLRITLDALKVTWHAAGLAVDAVGAVVAPVAAAVYQGTKSLAQIGVGMDVSGADIGRSMADGYMGAIDAAREDMGRHAEGLAKAAKDGFSGPRGIDAHSPSKWFELQGKNSVDGYEAGLEKGQDRAASSAIGIIPGAIGGGGAPGGSFTIHVGGIHVTVAGGKDTSKQVRAALSAPSLLEEVTNLFERAAHAAGIPTQAAVVP